MKKKLAASFVVTIAAIPAATTGCKKQPLVDPDGIGNSGPDTVSVYRSGEGCRMHVPEHCPKGASCNPPPPTEIDCPASHRDAGEVDPAPKRPPGKEDWLRATPHLYAARSGCGYTAPYFCAPPGKPHECMRPPNELAYVQLKCAVVEAGAGATDGGVQARDAGPPKPKIHIESFVRWDGFGCEAIPAFDCEEGDNCLRAMPSGTTAPCPTK